MKKVFFIIFVLLSIFVANACECFGDPLKEVNLAGIVKQGVNIRNLPCMHASHPITVARAGEKVRIVTKDPGRWYKISIYRNGKVIEGRVAQQFIKITNDRSNVPPKATNHRPKSYCDTENPARCPDGPACSKNISPTFHYENSNNTAKTSLSSNNKTENKNKKNPNGGENKAKKAVSKNIYTKIDQIVLKFKKYLDTKFETTEEKKEYINKIITKLKNLKDNNKYSQIISYLITKLQNLY